MSLPNRAPSASYSVNQPYGIWPAPAIAAAQLRSTAMKRATKIVLPPCRSKNEWTRQTFASLSPVRRP